MIAFMLVSGLLFMLMLFLFPPRTPLSKAFVGLLLLLYLFFSLIALL